MTGWEQVGAIVAVLTPVVGGPLTALTFYLRNIRDQQAERIAELSREADRLADSLAALTERLNDLVRDAATKEEWLRESVLARSERKWLTEAVIRLQVDLEAVFAAENGGRDYRCPRLSKDVPDTATDLQGEI
jgi:hypothetical protein